MKKSHYELQVLKTESINFDAIRSRVTVGAVRELKEQLHILSKAAASIDAIKKHLFYGKGLNTPIEESEPAGDKLTDRDLRLIHCVLGLLSESAETIDGLKMANDDGVTINPDIVNITEEIGDILWYSAVMCDAAGSNLETAMEKNLAKLKKRYGDSFSEKKAIERDVKAEYDILKK